MKTTLILKCFFLSILFFLCFLSSVSYASKTVVLLDVDGAIGPAAESYIEHGINSAAQSNAVLIILRLDTPGGLETSMRGINKAILASSIPVVTYVAPEGARAASAGTFILYASHVAAMAPGTNLGAASPVSINEASPTGNTSNLPDTMTKKSTNDAAAYIRSLAELRGRNADWGEKAVRAAVSLSAEEALKIHVIDVIANNIPDLLQKINGRIIKMPKNTETLETSGLTIEPMKPDWRYQFLSIITDPSIAYMLLLIGIYGLFFEFYNPGFVLPGVAGAICLLLALYAFELLPINYVGFALLLLGLAFMVIEVYIASFGVLGLGGLIAFIVGSVFLLDTNAPGFSIAWQLILAMSLVTVAFFLLIFNLAIRSMRQKVVTGREALIGSEGLVLEYNEHYCLVRIKGEIWQAKSDTPLHPGQKISVIDVSNLVLNVKAII